MLHSSHSLKSTLFSSVIRGPWSQDRMNKTERPLQSSAMLRLPTETLIVILRLVISGSRHDIDKTLRSCELLSHVCARLRDIMLDLRDLWSVVHFPLHWSSRTLLLSVSTLLQRVKDTPIQIVVRESNSHWKENIASITRAFKELFSSSHLVIESLELRLYSIHAADLPTQLLDVLRCAPRFLTIRHAPRPKDQVAPDCQLISTRHTTFICPITSVHVPDLERIRLVNLRGTILVNPPWRKLLWRSLIIEADADALPRSGVSIPVGTLIQNCKQLETLHVGAHSFNSINLSLGLPPLKELYVHDLHYFVGLAPQSRHSAFPNLVKFGVCIFTDVELGIFLESHPTIVDLTLDSEFDADVIAKSCPQVTTIRIPMSNWLDIAEPVPRLFGEEWVLMTDSRGTRAQFRFSAVEQLCLHDSSGYMTPESFDRLVKRRVIDAHRDSSLIRIQTVSIRGLQELGSDGVLSPEWQKSRYAQSAHVQWDEDECFFTWPQIEAD
ncbi:hypothetical protein PIIN_07787 [Serendipita indica DSM 11827]|uniref:F-box domain-containing protein n=1 Tax=Serendipita indica (strain DSM 11827) TaxID=1109443 RepID=G4TR90_SERID|nr:hypothetical protein PIIN_07787 [Serendipita indica DSM 11827]